MLTLTVTSPKSSIAIATCLPVVYYSYLQPTMATCSLLWLHVVYYLYVYLYMYSTMATCSLLWLPVVYYLYLYLYMYSTMATCSLLWLPVVYCVYLQSTMTIPITSLQCCQVFCTQLLYYAYLVFIITASVLLSLHYLLNLPVLLSALLTHSCIPCLVYR